MYRSDASLAISRSMFLAFAKSSLIDQLKFYFIKRRTNHLGKKRDLISLLQFNT